MAKKPDFVEILLERGKQLRVVMRNVRPVVVRPMPISGKPLTQPGGSGGPS